ncbi:MAG: histidine phosphatase family protein [Candidatus Shapirobacteria bacterium]
MKVYFVRHGSTDSLEKRISQPDDEPLNENGRIQAKELGKRFVKTNLDLVISSPYTRAVETAKAIREEVVTSELFKEVKKPTEVVGRSKDEEEVKNILKKIGEMYLTDPSWHFSDEESFEDLKKRGLEALEFLKAQNKENILVVSHGNFVALLVGLMLYGENYPVDVSLRLKNFLRFGNTGVSIVIYEEERWRLVCWNDTSHFLERN